ncbi:MAG: dolichyl-phosphate beta-D-mannosyltransferase [Candidatus Marinimicrobia bacterium]|nr:dolichyl-phosphate beta-D-mannosyltransferase [Candidatus Neomarinimicrobiota bacterium]
MLVISPTYNERKNIKRLVDMVLGDNPEFDLLIVDDNSPDGTSIKVKELQNKYKNLHLELREKKSGLGTAYIYGFKWALQHNYDIIIQMDADLSHNPKDLPMMVSYLKENDLIIGSRYINGISVVNWPLRRLMLSYGANTYSRIITGMPIMDGTGGFKAWKSKVLSDINLDSVKSQGYSFQIEMNFRAWIKGYKIKEIPIIFSDRTIGQSKMSKKIVYEAIFMVWRLRIWKIFGWHVK